MRSDEAVISISFLIILLLLTGAFAGIMAGLLGIGGGAVIVPALYYILLHAGYETVAMHVAVGTSLAAIIFTGASSAYAHHRYGAVDLPLFKQLLPGVVLGVGIGTLMADYFSTSALKAIFAASQIGFGSYMLIRTHKTALFKAMPRQPWVSVVSAVNACLATLMGVGGGVQNVVFMSICNVPMHRAIATAAAVGPFIALIGAAGFITIGWGAEVLPPLSLGYVNLGAFAVIISSSVLCAPLGARLAHNLPVAKLKRAFAVFMLLVAAKMLFEILYPAG